MSGEGRLRALLGPQPLPCVVKRSFTRLFCLSVSAATFLLLRRWQALLPANDIRYYAPWAPTLVSVAALCALQFMVSLACVAAVWIFWPRIQMFPVLRAAFFLAALFLLLNPLRLPAADWFPMLNRAVAQGRLGDTGFWGLFLLTSIAFLGAILKWPLRAERTLGNALLIMAPTPLVLLVRILPSLHGAPPPPQIGQRLDGPAPHRQLYLLIFDEWDYGWTFAHRPEGLALPNLEALMPGAFQADRAYPPTAATETSVPSLLSGMIFEKAVISPRQEYLLKKMEGGAWVAHSDIDDLPRVASRLAQRTLLIGCLHSYSAEYQRHRPLLDLYRRPFLAEWKLTADVQGASLVGSFGGLAKLAVTDIGGVRGLVQPIYQRQLLEDFESRLLAEARNPQHDLIIAHLPVPHAPALAGSDSRFPGQLANMPLMDNLVGRLSRQLVASGRWSTTTLILTSDHWQRDISAVGRLPSRPARFDTPEMRRRVPLVIWMPDHPRGEPTDTPMNNRIVYPMIKAWLNGVSLCPKLVEAEARRVPSQGFYDPAIR